MENFLTARAVEEALTSRTSKEISLICILNRRMRTEAAIPVMASMERAEPQNENSIETAVSFRENLPTVGGRTPAMINIFPAHTPNHRERTHIQGTIKMATRKTIISAVTAVMTATAIPTRNIAKTILGSLSITTFTRRAATKDAVALTINMKATTTAGMYPTTTIAKIVGLAPWTKNMAKCIQTSTSHQETTPVIGTLARTVSTGAGD